MSDDPVLAALARLEAGQVDITERVIQFGSRLSAIESEQARLREQLNDKMDDMLDKMSSVRADTDTTRGHVLYGLQENLTLSQRITKIEDEMRGRKRDR